MILYIKVLNRHWVLVNRQQGDIHKEEFVMKSIERIDQQPTAIDQPLLRLRNVIQNRRSGKDRRRGVTYMDPALDRRKGERRKNSL